MRRQDRYFWPVAEGLISRVPHCTRNVVFNPDSLVFTRPLAKYIEEVDGVWIKGVLWYLPRTVVDQSTCTDTTDRRFSVSTPTLPNMSSDLHICSETWENHSAVQVGLQLSFTLPCCYDICVNTSFLGPHPSTYTRMYRSTRRSR